MSRARLGVYAMVPMAIFHDDLKQSEIAVYAAISSFQGSNDNAWPSIDSIAERSGLSRYTVSRATSALAEKGWVQKKRRSAKNQTNVYTVLFKAEEVVDNPVDNSDRVAHSEQHGNETELRTASNTELRTARNSFLYSKRTSEKNKEVRPAKAERLRVVDNSVDNSDTKKRAQELSPMKDPVANRYQELLTSETPHTSWKSIPAERKTLDRLAAATKRLDSSMMPDAGGEHLLDLVAAIVGTFRDMKSESQADYWRNAPFTPSSLFSRWDSVIERFRGRSEEDREYQKHLAEAHLWREP